MKAKYTNQSSCSGTIFNRCQLLIGQKFVTANIKFDHDVIFPRNLHAEGYGDRELCHSMSTITPSTVAVPHTKQCFIEADEKVVLILTQSCCVLRIDRV